MLNQKFHTESIHGKNITAKTVMADEVASLNILSYRFHSHSEELQKSTQFGMNVSGIMEV